MSRFGNNDTKKLYQEIKLSIYRVTIVIGNHEYTKTAFVMTFPIHFYNRFLLNILNEEI